MYLYLFRYLFVVEKMTIIFETIYKSISCYIRICFLDLISSVDDKGKLILNLLWSSLSLSLSLSLSFSIIFSLFSVLQLHVPAINQQYIMI